MKSVCYKKHYVWCCGIVNTLYLGVFPAHAGVFLDCKCKSDGLHGFPRTRGGVSKSRNAWYLQCEFSPHTRGCFQIRPATMTPCFVFPAHAGVFLRQAGLLKFLSSFPRTRGGVSWFMPPLVVCIWFSPHTRGCFQRKRYVGGIGDGFPRTRGGVSNYRLEDSINMEFSPHTRGCFCLKRATEAMLVVFPAHAGVFPLHKHYTISNACFPRTRGGVSTGDRYKVTEDKFSPHARGCLRRKA